MDHGTMKAGRCGACGDRAVAGRTLWIGRVRYPACLTCWRDAAARQIAYLRRLIPGGEAS